MEQRAHGLHLGGWFFEHRQQFAHFVQPADDHDQQRFEEEAIRVDDGPSGGTTRWWWRGWDAIDQTDQLRQEGIVGD